MHNPDAPMCVSSSSRASTHAKSALSAHSISSSLAAYFSRIRARRSYHLPRCPRRQRFCARRDSKTLSSYSCSPRIPSECAPLQIRRVRTYPIEVGQKLGISGGRMMRTALEPLQSIPPRFLRTGTFTLYLHESLPVWVHLLEDLLHYSRRTHARGVRFLNLERHRPGRL